MRKLFLRSFAIAFVAFAALFAVEFFGEWARAGYPPLHEMSFAGVNNNANLVNVLSPMARAYNNVLAMLIATIGLAIPLTANMHTPKLIEMFLKDRVNRYVLGFMALGAANTLWVDYMIGPGFAPMIAINLAIYLALVGWALLIPYFFYVVRFVDPSQLIIRLRDGVVRDLERVRARQLDPVKGQIVLSTSIGQIGTIIVKSLDRSDRDVAAEGAWAIKTILDAYDKEKFLLGKEWFAVDRADFVGVSDEALEMMSANRTWFEMKCLQQLELGYLRALASGTESVSTFSDALRVIAVQREIHHDEEALRLCVRFFNNLLREAIKAKNLRAVYDVFHQYRRLGEELIIQPELLREIGKHFRYYAGMSRIYGMLFAPQLAVFDLCFMTRRAYERRSEAAPALLGDVLVLPHRTGDDTHTMAVKAKLLLGAFFVATSRSEEAARVRANLADVAAAQIARAETDLLAADRSFFEVTDRQLNLEFVIDEHREPLAAFCATLTRA